MSRAITLDKIPVAEIPDPPEPKREDLPRPARGSNWVIYGSPHFYVPAWLDFTLDNVTAGAPPNVTVNYETS